MILCAINDHAIIIIIYILSREGFVYHNVFSIDDNVCDFKRTDNFFYRNSLVTNSCMIMFKKTVQNIPHYISLQSDHAIFSLAVLQYIMCLGILSVCFCMSVNAELCVILKHFMTMQCLYIEHYIKHHQKL